jgi:hypothetical protein
LFHIDGQQSNNVLAWACLNGNRLKCSMLNGEQKKISGRERKTEKVAKETFKE